MFSLRVKTIESEHWIKNLYEGLGDFYFCRIYITDFYSNRYFHPKKLCRSTTAFCHSSRKYSAMPCKFSVFSVFGRLDFRRSLVFQCFNKKCS